jgi:hypothetical protein
MSSARIPGSLRVTAQAGATAGWKFTVTAAFQAHLKCGMQHSVDMTPCAACELLIDVQHTHQQLTHAALLAVVLCACSL